jgi:hypothetical protein
MMIVWLNGTHGAGKTTTSALVQQLIPDSRVFDAEKVGETLMDIDLQGGLFRREVRGVDDLGLGVQPRAGRLGVGLKVLETEWGGAQKSVPLDAPAEGVLVSVEDEVPYRDGMFGEARADLPPVLTERFSWPYVPGTGWPSPSHGWAAQ